MKWGSSRVYCKLKSLSIFMKIFQYNRGRGEDMIYREHYIRPVREFYESDLIKIITGIRRSGKSAILR